MIDTSYKYFEFYSKLKNPKNMVLLKISVSENCENCLKKFFSVNFARFGVHKTLKNTCQMKDKIKCIKTLYIFYKKFDILNSVKLLRKNSA